MGSGLETTLGWGSASSPPGKRNFQRALWRAPWAGFQERGQNGVLLVQFVLAFEHIRRKPSESVPFSLTALKSGMQRGILPPKIHVTYFPSALPPLLLAPDSCIHLLGPASMPRAADRFEHMLPPSSPCLNCPPAEGGMQSWEVPHHQKMRRFQSVSLILSQTGGMKGNVYAKHR